LTYTGLTAGRKTRTPARKRTKGGAPGTLLEGIVERVKGWKPPPRQHAGRAKGSNKTPPEQSQTGGVSRSPAGDKVPGRKGLRPGILDTFTYTGLTAGRKTRTPPEFRDGREFFILRPAKEKPRIGAGLRVSGERRSFFGGWARRLVPVTAQGIGMRDAHVAAPVWAGSGVPFVRGVFVITRQSSAESRKPG